MYSLRDLQFYLMLVQLAFMLIYNVLCFVLLYQGFISEYITNILWLDIPGTVS